MKLENYDVGAYEEIFRNQSLFEADENVRHEVKVDQGKALTFRTYGGMLDPVALAEEK